MISIEMNLPPSLNMLFKNKRKGRAKTNDYVNWQVAALWGLKARYRNVVCPSPFAATIRVGKCSQARDLDNVPKGILDTLTKAEVIADDNMKNMHVITIMKDFENVPEGKVIVELKHLCI